jgi:glycosyltransferase involved in cell wall biosynthesis
MSGPAEESPAVSIGMAVFNGATHIREALDSLLGQTFSGFELIISDNGSTDGTAEICAEYAARDARIRFTSQPTNVGPARNFAFVLEAARAPYFMFAAHDDRWEPSFIARLLAALEAAPDAVLAFSRWDAINERGEHVLEFTTDWEAILSASRFRRLWAFVTLPERWTLKALFYYGLMRRAIWLEEFTRYNGYDAYAGSDMLMVLAMASRGRFAFVPEVLFHNRIRPLKSRQREPVVRYVARRAAGRTPGHRGSALDMLRRIHRYHGGVRDVVRAVPALPRAQRLVLVGITVARELRGYLVEFPLAVARELGIARPSRLARAAELKGPGNGESGTVISRAAEEA